MAITKIQSESLNLADTYDFTGTVTGAGGNMTPCFEAQTSATQNLPDSSAAKMVANSVKFNVGSCYDGTTNYRFTPTTAGKYALYMNAVFDSSSTDDILQTQIFIYKNGSDIARSIVYDTSKHHFQSDKLFLIDEANGSTDYYEAYVWCDISTGNTGQLKFTSAYQENYFGAYKIIE